MMDRSDWLKERRLSAEERYDTLFAPDYDEKWGIYGNDTHHIFIRKFLDLLSPHSVILDAACGTGKYWPELLEKGHTVFGTDQSQGMLSKAKEKFPDVRVEKMGLQEISFQGAFDGIICMDAMEFVSPEDWPLVLQNFRQALKPGQYIYFTVELPDEAENQDAFKKGQEMGLPVVYGEWAHQGGYHFYPTIDQVKAWIQSTGFTLIEEAEGDSYYHLILKSGVPPRD